MVTSAARLFHELAESLSARGHQVTVVTSMPDRYMAHEGTQYRRRLYMREMVGDIRTHRVRGLPIPKAIPFLRGIEHFFVGFAYLLVGLFLGRRNAVIVYSPPLPLGLTAYLLARLSRGIFVLNVQDLYPQTAIDLGLLRSRLLIGMSRKLERFLYRRADVITVHSQGNREYVIGRGAAPERVHVILNWVDLDFVHPGPRENGFRAQQGLKDAFVVSYAGVMGFAQGLEDVVEAAERLRQFPDILFLLVGEGVARPALEQEVRRRNLSNVRFLPMQSPEVYVQLLNASDVGLATLRKELRTPVVPGKVQSIMAVGRPVVCSLDPHNDTVRLVQESACGICVEAGHPDQLAEAILSLYQDRSLALEMGQRGRAYAEQHFSPDTCISQYEELLRAASPKES